MHLNVETSIQQAASFATPQAFLHPSSHPAGLSVMSFDIKPLTALAPTLCHLEVGQRKTFARIWAHFSAD